jgi:hypothetical protein
MKSPQKIPTSVKKVNTSFKNVWRTWGPALPMLLVDLMIYCPLSPIGLTNFKNSAKYPRIAICIIFIHCSTLSGSPKPVSSKNYIGLVAWCCWSPDWSSEIERSNTVKVIILLECLKWTVAQSLNATNILFERPKAAPN